MPGYASHRLGCYSRRLPFGLVHHDESGLLNLGNHVAAFLQREQIRREREEKARLAEESRRKATVMGLLTSQAGHRLVQVLQRINYCAEDIRQAVTTPGRQQHLSALEKSINEGDAIVRRARDLADQTHPRDRRRHSLADIVADALERFAGKAERARVRVHPQVPEDITVLVDRDQITEALANVVSNAIHAIVTRRKSSPCA